VGTRDVGAGRLALALLLPPAGVVLYARAAWGSWSPWPVAAALLACNATFLLNRPSLS